MSKSVQEILMFDYDGTLTLPDGTFAESTKRILSRMKDSQKEILGIVSGRHLEFLKEFSENLSNPFSFLVAENGAIAHFCDTGQTLVLGEDWSKQAREVFAGTDIPLHFFEVMGTTRREYTTRISDILHESGLEAKIVTNLDTLMVLPPNVDKGTGVASAVAHFGSTSKIYLTCFGDGENDLALFSPADFRVAVSNAIDPLKKIADVVTTQPGGLGVEEYLKERYFGEAKYAPSEDINKE